MNELIDVWKSLLKHGVCVQVFMAQRKWKSAWRRGHLFTESLNAPDSGSPQAEHKQKLGEHEGAEGSRMLAPFLPSPWCLLTATDGYGIRARGILGQRRCGCFVASLEALRGRDVNLRKMHRKELHFPEVLSLKRNYQISLLNDLVFKIAEFGATLLSCHVNPGPYKVVYLGLVWVDSYG